MTVSKIYWLIFLCVSLCTFKRRHIFPLKHTFLVHLKTLFLFYLSHSKSEKIGDLSDEVKQLQKSLQSCKASSADAESQLKQRLEDSEVKVNKTYGELDTVRAERDKMSELCRQHSKYVIVHSLGIHPIPFAVSECNHRWNKCLYILSIPVVSIPHHYQELCFRLRFVIFEYFLCCRFHLFKNSA